MSSQTTDSAVRRPGDAAESEERILSKAVKAGRRTYFFDVRATRGNDYYLTITESKKSTAVDGTVSFDRHKIFLYKEDFDKFAEGLQEVIDYIRTNCLKDLPAEAESRPYDEF